MRTSLPAGAAAIITKKGTIIAAVVAAIAKTIALNPYINNKRRRQ
nr:hypothetical protein [Desulforamulus aquiferis]